MPPEDAIAALGHVIGVFMRNCFSENPDNPGQDESLVMAVDFLGACVQNACSELDPNAVRVEHGPPIKAGRA